MSTETPEYLLWFDYETTGLDPHTDVPIEVAAVVTTADTLEEIDGCETLIWTSPSKVETCGARDMHEASGLLAAWMEAQKDSRGDAETDIVKMLDDHEIQTVTLAGSGVATFDLPRIRLWMPTLATRLTYHVHDVGVMRRAYRRATGSDLTPRTEPAHRAMADVRQPLSEGRAFADLFRANRQESDHE